MVYIFALFLIIYVLCCLVLVGFILTQEGKGGGLSGVMGASMGETFGFGGATTTIRKFTSIAAAVFLAFTIVLTFLGERVVNQYSNAFLAAEGAAPAAAPGAPATATTKPSARPAASPAASSQVTVKPESAPVEVKTEAAQASTAAPATAAPAPAEAAPVAASTNASEAAPAPAAVSPVDTSTSK